MLFRSGGEGGGGGGTGEDAREDPGSQDPCSEFRAQSLFLEAERSEEHARARVQAHARARGCASLASRRGFRQRRRRRGAGVEKSEDVKVRREDSADAERRGDFRDGDEGDEGE